MADSLRDLLAGVGYTVQVAYGGPEGIEKIKRASFNVVVTDLRMQDIDGLSVIRFIYENSPRTLIIVITGYASTESAVQALHLQVFDYLRKPFDFSLFQMVIEKAFQKIETEQLREDTAAMITHDIKIPLTSIIGFASMLYDRERQEFHPRAREFAEAIQTNGQKILGMIENYLTTCKIESGTLQIMPVPVDIRQMLLDIVDTSIIGASRRGREIVHQIGALPGTVDVDEPLLYRAVSNLLQNAIKYSSGEGPIRVWAGLVEPAMSPLKSMSLCIEVMNHASMIDVEDFEGIFQRYKRLAVRPGIEGSGLGLYVVQAIVKAHGGEVTAQILDGGLVRFALYLPLSSTAEARA